MPQPGAIVVDVIKQPPITRELGMADVVLGAVGLTGAIMIGAVVTGLAVSYGRTEALKGIDLSVAAGQVVSLIGANGAGKTTAMRALSGLVRPRAGRITFTFSDRPMQLTSWIVVDGQGQTTRVALNDARTDIQLDPALFRFTPPPSNLNNNRD